MNARRHPIAQGAIDILAVTFGIIFLMTFAVGTAAGIYRIVIEIEYASRSSG